MTQNWFRLYVQRIDASRNMARYYTMSIEPDLFRGSALVRRWCRIGTRGQARIHPFENDGQAISRFPFLTRHKRARGYRPLSYS
ncbi:WGR domain-containing protein [Sinorhizobium psoraleae]|uniref:WGR domain-containing protein n=1 Tax=Sinorhizobium psoraleae TaxID=520838 RepID=A0ABT4KNK5_9HYPH|nr:WGR domain-containing protein [Sinorhizobium psoraleae]MCZ4093546.1 WGR domain-containing protein [Sinorhizobium psoraleae]